jgi:hypothetical protein
MWNLGRGGPGEEDVLRLYAATHPSQAIASCRCIMRARLTRRCSPRDPGRAGCAAAAGSAFYTRQRRHRAGRGKSTADQRPHVRAGYPLHADLCVHRAWKADTSATCSSAWLNAIQPHHGDGARIAIVEVETTSCHRELTRTRLTPGVYVDRLVRIPPDGIGD